MAIIILWSWHPVPRERGTMTSIEGLPAMHGPGTISADPSPPTSAGETDFGQMIQQARMDADGVERAAPEPRVETEAITVRATEPSISERFGSRLEALNASRLLERGAGPPEAEPTVSSLQGGEAATGPSAMLGARPKPGAAFDDAVRNLQSAFHHAIEVELVAKTGTSLNSSMNKLMSGS